MASDLHFWAMSNESVSLLGDSPRWPSDVQCKQGDWKSGRACTCFQSLAALEHSRCSSYCCRAVEQFRNGSCNYFSQVALFDVAADR